MCCFSLNELLNSNLSSDKAIQKWKDESQLKVHDLVDELRVRTQDGLDMYKNTNISGNKYSSQDEYSKYFNEELKKANSKCGH